MRYKIYVPQGRAARFNKDTLAYGIDGLYTDGFSNCVIIAFTGKNGRSSLMHFDSISDYEVIKKEAGWVGESCEVTLIFRNSTSPVIKSVLEYFTKNISGIRPKLEKIGNKDDGVLLSFNEPQISIYPIDAHPKYLLHHPLEERFLAVQKIDQIIGVADKYINNSIVYKYPYVFENYFWTHISECETQLPMDNRHPKNKEYMTSFEKDEPLVKIGGRLGGIILDIEKVMQDKLRDDLKETMLNVGFYLEGYLNNYDYVLLFQRNMKDVLDSGFYKPETIEDKKYMGRLLLALNKDDDCFDEVKKIIGEYEKAPDSETKKNILNEHKAFSEHYHDRKYYKDLEKENNKFLSDANGLSKKAVENFRAEKYEAASNLFAKVLGKLIRVCTEDNKDLITVYYNLGRALYKLNEHDDGKIAELNTAKMFLNISLMLKRTHYKENTKDIEKNERAVKDCDKAIESLHINHETKQFSQFNLQ